MRRILLIGSLLLVMAFSFSGTYACGIPQFTVDHLSSADVIVYAKVVEVDESRLNAILSIERYFKGEGSKYLPVVTQLPSEIVAGRRREYSLGGCVGGRGWFLGEEGYFALARRDNGTFDDHVGNGSVGTIDFSEFERTVWFKRTDDTQNRGYREENLPVADFERLIIELGGGTGVILPDVSSPYPSKRFVDITTEAGTRYRLNPDTSITQLDPRLDPIAVSPDGTHKAFQLDETTLAFSTYTRLPNSKSFVIDGQEIQLYEEVAGRKLRFSPDSNFVSVWDENQLTVYMFNNFVESYDGRLMGLRAIGEVRVLNENADNFPLVAWSGDSTTLAFRDDAGLWLWNIYHDAAPTRLLPPEELTAFSLLELSNSGRYVRYGENDRWMLLDTETGETHQNALITPNEGNLIYLNVEPPSEFQLDLAFEYNCAIPLTETCPYYIYHHDLQHMFWYRNDQLVLVGCSKDECMWRSLSWKRAINRSGSNQLSSQGFIRDLAYDDQFDALAVVRGDHLLEMVIPSGQTVYHLCCDEDYRYVLDLTEQLDSPIASVEWGQPIFYREPPVVQ